jgi:hypothetical protein
MSQKKYKHLRSQYRDAIKGDIEDDLVFYQNLAHFWFSEFEKLKDKISIYSAEILVSCKNLEK